MTYHEAISYLNSFIDYERVVPVSDKKPFDLKRVERFLGSIGDPHHTLRCIHIAGTKGKGSTCACIASILREAGYRVGLYTSPHLSDFRERIRVLTYPRRTVDIPPFEGAIPQGDFADLLTGLLPAIDSFSRQKKSGSLTFFEILTALAFVYFAQKKLDFVVLETGLGGRLDATNSIRSLVCAITPLSYEHTALLGDTLGKIAAEKAGIIKDRRSIVVSAPQAAEAHEVIRKRCRTMKAQLIEVGRDIVFERLPLDTTAEVFNVYSKDGDYRRLKIRLYGFHQVVNAATAIGVIGALRQHGSSISDQAIRRGLLHTFWPARFEAVSRRPVIIIDGVQNRASARALTETLKERFPGKKFTLVFGASKDKDIKGIAEELFPLCKKIVLTKSGNPRATPPRLLLQITAALRKRVDASVSVVPDIKKALVRARQGAGRYDVIVVTGSLFVAGEARQICRG